MLLLGEVIMIATTVMIMIIPSILKTRVLTRNMHKSSLRISINGSKDLASSGSN
jgi:small-conductance mechanosensitive channel